MPVHVVLEYSPQCPRCDVALKLLREICEKLSVPLVVRRIGTECGALDSHFWRTSPSVVHTFTEEFARHVGDEEAARAIRTLKMAGLDPRELTPTPIIRIVVAGVRGKREIVIKGFPVSEDKLRAAYTNIFLLLSSLVKT